MKTKKDRNLWRCQGMSSALALFTSVVTNLGLAVQNNSQPLTAGTALVDHAQ